MLPFIVSMAFLARSGLAIVTKPKPREQASAVSRLLQEPAVLLTGLQIMRLLGPRVIVPVILLGAVAGGGEGHTQASHLVGTLLWVTGLRPRTCGRRGSRRRG